MNRRTGEPANEITKLSFAGSPVRRFTGSPVSPEPPPSRSALRRASRAPTYCTLAVTLAADESVNVHVLRLSPPLEHAPDQIASRPLVTLSVMLVPGANEALPLLPVGTLIPAGDDVTRSPLRPVAVTVSATVAGGCEAGFTVIPATRVTLA